MIHGKRRKKLWKNTNFGIDYIYDLAMKSGSLGGKLLGAGSGGFLLFYVPLNKHEIFKKNLRTILKFLLNFLWKVQVLFIRIRKLKKKIFEKKNTNNWGKRICRKIDKRTQFKKKELFF